MGVADITSTWGRRSPAALGRQGRSLIHAEPVLLVGDHQPQPPEGHPWLSRAWVPTMRSISPASKASWQARFWAAVMDPMRSPTRRPVPPAAPPWSAGAAGPKARGGHEGHLAAVPPGQIRAGGGHHRLARAHVPLEQAVHRHGPAQIRCGLFHRPPLGPGEGEGQGAGKCLKILFRKGDGLLLPPAAPDEGKAQVQAEKFLKHQPPPCLGQGPQEAG